MAAGAASRPAGRARPRVTAETLPPPVLGKENARTSSRCAGREPGQADFPPAGFLPPTHIAGTGSTMPLHDKFGRQITDVRISVTDRCNFRCVYCRSADPENYRPEEALLTWAELERVARVLRGLGLEKVRVTGGEPMARPGVVEFIARVRGLGFPDVSMTTNGQMLAEKCDALVRAGLTRINISLDSLDAAKFERVTRTRKFQSVMDGIHAAQASALGP